MSALAIIPARGGSKGLPRKNVRLLCGKPLIAWMIDAARAAETVRRIVVSTDDAEIAEVSRTYGAEVVRRPDDISDNRASSEAALLHAVRSVGVRDGALAFLQCTAPLTLSSDIDGTVRLLQGADSAFTVTPGHRFEWRNARDGPVPIGHRKGHRPMRQQLQDRYVEVGAVYAMTVEGFIRSRSRFPGRTALYPLPPDRSVEIDDETDFFVAEALMRRRLEREKRSALPSVVEAVVMDFDGVLTDNRVYVGEGGNEAVACHRGDGWAIQRLKEAGVRLLVLTNESNPAVKHRCDKLGVQCIVAEDAKLPRLREWLDMNDIEPGGAVYVGNDQPDAHCMRYVGCGVAPADALPPALNAARLVLDSPGGRGCIRELAGMLVDD